uniref:Uncharacterized protein n=1 Tax=Caenorhabditis japonica TaxID=281687 RepID=A0A8R1DEH8_CAEJA
MPEMLKNYEKENFNEENTKKPLVEQFPVNFKRAVCIHSTLQFVDLFMQSLLFTHGFSMSSVIPMVQEDEEFAVSKTLRAFEKIRKEFREIFRSRHRNSISEVAIFIGTCPLRSTYSYRIPINLCEAQDSRHDACGDTCAELNDAERRKINRDLFLLRQSASTPEFEKNLCKPNHRMFVFVKGSDEMVGEEIEEE